MNVFILSAGRCGSATFVHACSHIKNYSTAHESRSNLIEGRLDYPDNHIESDNHLSWFLGRLDERYGDDAYYVHLKRDIDAQARSWAKRYGKNEYKKRGYMWAYRNRLIWKGEKNASLDKLSICRHYIDTVNSNICMFLKDKSRQMEFQIESAKKDFERFWYNIDAEGDVSMAIEEWSKNYNASLAEEDPKREGDVPNILPRIVGKVKRAAFELPSYLKNV